MNGKDLLSISDLTSEDIGLLISDAVAMKTRGWSLVLDGKILALLFEKPSLRTRVSFEVAMRQLGGQALYLSPAEVGLGERESVPDAARVPVINALSDLEHPCQALADLVTIYEKKGELRGLTLAFVGDGNNVAHSLLLAASLAGMNFRIASPPDYAVQEKILHQAQDYATDSGAEIFCTEEPGSQRG